MRRSAYYKTFPNLLGGQLACPFLFFKPQSHRSIPDKPTHWERMGKITFHHVGQKEIDHTACTKCTCGTVFIRPTHDISFSCLTGIRTPLICTPSEIMLKLQFIHRGWSLYSPFSPVQIPWISLPRRFMWFFGWKTTSTTKKTIHVSNLPPRDNWEMFLIS